MDGLRAVAVLAVLFFHGHVFRFTGGYVGVDAFFVISGYLITGLIVRDMDEGRFSLILFYERRARRIFPALFGLLGFCVLAGLVLLVPEDLVQFSKSLIASTLFVSNIYFWRSAQPLGYFSHTSATEALLHTWSLSVEEQFYLVFPALMLLLYRVMKRWMKLCLLFLAAASFGLNVWATQHRPVAAFYFSIPRAWELLLGALLAVGVVPPLRRRMLREIAGVLGIGMIAVAIFAFSEATLFPGVSALLPCMGTWLLIYAGENGTSMSKSLLSWRPLVFIGVISYSLYLWHWPLLVFARYFAAGDLTTSETIEILICSLILAFLSFEFVERPFRGTQSAITRRQAFVFGLTASLLAVAIGLTMRVSKGLPKRYSERTRNLIVENESRRNDYDVSCSNWKTQVRRESDIKFCRLGSDSSRKIMFWGDSHVEQMLPTVKKLYRDGNLHHDGVLFAIANGCLPAQDLNSTGSGYHCDAFSKFALARAEKVDIAAVFIGFDTWWGTHDDSICLSVDGLCTETLTTEETERRFLPELAATIRLLRGLRKRVVVCLPFPMYDKSIPELEMRNAVFGRLGLSGRATDFTSPALREAIRSAAVDAGADVFDPRLSLCKGGNCMTEMNGVSIYIDSHHLAASASDLLKANLRNILQ